MSDVEDLEDALLRVVERGEGRFGWHDIGVQLSMLDVPREPDMLATIRDLRRRGLLTEQRDSHRDRWMLTDAGRGFLARGGHAMRHIPDDLRPLARVLQRDPRGRAQGLRGQLDPPAPLAAGLRRLEALSLGPHDGIVFACSVLPEPTRTELLVAFSRSPDPLMRRAVFWSWNPVASASAWRAHRARAPLLTAPLDPPHWDAVLRAGLVDALPEIRRVASLLAIDTSTATEHPTVMTHRRKNAIKSLLHSIETGDPAGVAVVDEARYIQHNPQTHEGSEGLAALFARLAKTNPRVNVARIFSDGDFVFGHTEYDFATRRIGFEVFRFDGDVAVEHWDNIQPRQGPNPAGHSMVDGETEATDLEHTETNRAHVRTMVETVFIGRDHDSLQRFVDMDRLVQHHPALHDGGEALRQHLARTDDDHPAVAYEHLHRVLAEGSFVLTVCEGSLAGKHSALYDLFRVEGGRVVEHWSTQEFVPDPTQWKNDNGKF
jgi:predicted SnoaL-like aldol condensation-catalyzing enzyme